MKKFSKIVLALIAVAGIAFTASCKSDCEKAYDNMIAKADEDTKKAMGTEEAKKTALEECGKLDADVQKCLAGAADQAAAAKCAADAKKKEEKKEEKK